MNDYSGLLGSLAPQFQNGISAIGSNPALIDAGLQIPSISNIGQGVGSELYSGILSSLGGLSTSDILQGIGTLGGLYMNYQNAKHTRGIDDANNRRAEEAHRYAMRRRREEDEGIKRIFSQ